MRDGERGGRDLLELLLAAGLHGLHGALLLERRRRLARLVVAPRALLDPRAQKAAAAGVIASMAGYGSFSSASPRLG